MNKKKFLETIQDKSEKIEISRILDQIDLSQKYYKNLFTDFLRPPVLEKILYYLKDSDITYEVYGGFPDAERNILGFFVSIYDKEPPPVVPIEISFNKKFSKTLTHRDFLGSLIGLGISRDKIGDIVIGMENTVVIVKEEVADFILVNLERIGRSTVKTEIASLNMFEDKIEFHEPITKSVASMRLDNILSEVFNIPRSKAVDLIKKDRAFVDWVVVSKPDKIISENTRISLRGYGKITIISINGTTKKGNTYFTYCKPIS